MNLINAVKYCRSINCKVFGIVGRNGGYTFRNGDDVLLIPSINESLTTPLTESYQAIVWHCLVSNPLLQLKPTKW